MKMATHIFKLPEVLEGELRKLVEGTDLPKSYFFIEALKSYIRDRKDLIRSTAILEKASSGEVKLKSLSAIMAKRDLSAS